MGNLPPICLGKLCNEPGIFREQFLDCRFIGTPARSDQSHILRAALDQQPECVFMAKLFGDVMRRHIPTERPLINRPARL